MSHSPIADKFSGRSPWDSLDGRLSIHSKQSVAFTKSLNPPKLVISILEDGYKLPFKQSVPDYYEPSTLIFSKQKSMNGKSLDIVRKFHAGLQSVVQ